MTNAITGKVGGIYRQAGSAIAITNEACEHVSGYMTYRISDNSRRYLDRSQAITVYKKVNGAGDWVEVAAGVTVNPLSGYVIFDEALNSDDLVSVSGYYFAVTQIGGFFNWSLDLEIDMADVTDFESEGNKEYKSSLKGWTASAEAYYLNDYSDIAGEEAIVSFFVDATPGSLKRYEGYATINSISPSAPISEVVQQSFSFQGSGQLCYREG